MSLNLAAIIFPIAILLMVIEYLITTNWGKNYYDFDRTIANLSVGIAERLFDLFLHGFFYFVFQYIYEHYALFTISNAWYIWIVLLLSTDFVWYWYHRLGHEINLFWAFHIVHHQSEDYNLSVAARITNLQTIVRSLFWCVLPLLGFLPEMVSVVLVFHAAYSFFTHTRIGHQLKWLEYVFVTPSIHSVHHAANPEYLDKNYGDMFVFWDKLFGTFKRKEAAPIFGLTEPLKSNSFLWQHFHYLAEMAYRVYQTDGFANRIKVVFGKPSVMMGNERKILESKLFLQRRRFKVYAGVNYRKYVLVQIVAMLLLSFFLTLFAHYLKPLSFQIGVSFVLLTLINCGALLEQRKWIVLVEYVRLFLVLFGLGYYFDNGLCYLFFLLLFASVVVNYQVIKQNYYRIVYSN